MSSLNIRNLKRAKHREDGSDFDDFWMDVIVMALAIISEIFASSKEKGCMNQKFRVLVVVTASTLKVNVRYALTL